jgi:hypothetical protein
MREQMRPRICVQQILACENLFCGIWLHRTWRAIVPVRRVLVRQPGYSTAWTGPDLARRCHHPCQWSGEPAALRSRAADQLPGALWNCRWSTREHQICFHSFAPFRFAYAAYRGDQPRGIPQYGDAIQRARYMHDGKPRTRQRAVAAGVQSGWLAQHLSESRPRGLDRDAASQWPGSDFTPRCYRNSDECGESGLRLGAAERDFRHLAGEYPDIARCASGWGPDVA